MIALRKERNLGKKRKNLVSFLLDRTGSMGSIWEETINGFNVFLEEQRNQDYRTRWNVTVFDSQSIDLIRDGVKGKDMKKLTATEVTPRASTPLHDSIAHVVLEADKLASDYDGVIIVVLTDGYENASREYTLEEVRALIEARPDWQFIFLGVDIDAYATGTAYGFGTTVTGDRSSESMAGTYLVASATSGEYGSTGRTVSSHTDTTASDEEEETEEV
jgi:hypothetical protein